MEARAVLLKEQANRYLDEVKRRRQKERRVLGEAVGEREISFLQVIPLGAKMWMTG